MPVKSNHVIVGLTGGIAGGKSTVSEMFRDLGAQLIDFDALARKVVKPGTRGLAKIVDFFGRRILQSNGTLDRKKMSGIVFRDEEKRRALERLIHPDIHAAFVTTVSRMTEKKPDAIIVAEVPLLVEANLEHLFDKIVLVVASDQEQIRRLLSRDHITREAASDMIAAQLPVEKKKKAADYVIPNDGTLQATRRKVRAVWLELVRFQEQRDRSDPLST